MEDSEVGFHFGDLKWREGKLDIDLQFKLQPHCASSSSPSLNHENLVLQLHFPPQKGQRLCRVID